jgi:RNA polymerase sigma factor (sigma-70 family)
MTQMQDSCEAIIKHYARRYAHFHLVDYDDLLQVGHIGAWEAEKNFDPTKGAQFVTHATNRIKGEMLTELRKARNLCNGDWLRDAKPIYYDQSKDLSDYLNALLKDLTPFKRQIVQMRIQNYSYEDIGIKFGKSACWIKQTYKKTIAHLKEKYSRCGEI